MSHHSAIGDTISCDAPYSAIGFRGKLFLRYPLVRPVFADCDRPFLLRKDLWGCSSDSLLYHRKETQCDRGIATPVSQWGGYFGRVAKTNQARKKSTKINFLGPETVGWAEGVGVKKFVPSLKSLFSLHRSSKNAVRRFFLYYDQVKICLIKSSDSPISRGKTSDNLKNRLKGPLEDNLSDEKNVWWNRLIQAWICLSDVFYATKNRKRAIRQILPWERRSQYKKNRLTGIFGRSGWFSREGCPGNFAGMSQIPGVRERKNT